MKCLQSNYITNVKQNVSQNVGFAISMIVRPVSRTYHVDAFHGHRMDIKIRLIE